MENDIPVSHDSPESLKDTSEAMQQAQDYLEQLQRLTAEFHNYQKRVTKEKEQLMTTAKADFITKLLDIIDNLERAFTAQGKPEEIITGIKMTFTQLSTLLEKEGVVALDSVGKPYDPYVHEALAKIPTDAQADIVVQEFQKGYKMHDLLLRPAKVAISSQKEDMNHE